jgi:protoheme IX farnesyltransferase
MLAYTLVLVPVTLFPVVIGMAGAVYGVAAALLGAWLIRHAVRVVRDDGPVTARAMFFFTILYLFLIFAALLADKAVRTLS